MEIRKQFNNRKEYFLTFGVRKPKKLTQQEMRQRLTARGICIKCYKNPTEKFVTCQECRIKGAEYNRNKRKNG
jgi:hypothetical protein